ncbi:MAG: 1-deoxy-D-xylulose-5-phosphate reductoisomerase, partial [Planctomycetota bacterium]
MHATRVIILGSTGSIGTQTLEVLEHLNALADRGRQPRRFEVVGLAAGRNGELLKAQAERCVSSGLSGASGPAVALSDESAVYDGPSAAPVRRGAEACERLVRGIEAEFVMAAVVGSAGLPATLAAAELGRTIGLANKETLVSAGAIVTETCRRTKATLRPVDSEHSALWQSLMSVLGPRCEAPLRELPDEIERVTITASGGAFRDRDPREVYDATPEQALKHPTWDMGAKVTIDSATLVNKGLELVEAHWLFAVPSSRLDAIIHPEVAIHALIELRDRSVVAQLAAPDMRLPIRLAMTAPEITESEDVGPRRLDLTELGTLHFRAAPHDRYPALGLAHRAIEAGGTAGAVFTAANEAAVNAFLQRRIPFGRIVELCASAMDAIGPVGLTGLDVALDAERRACEFV